MIKRPLKYWQKFKQKILKRFHCNLQFRIRYEWEKRKKGEQNENSELNETTPKTTDQTNNEASTGLYTGNFFYNFL